MKIFNIDNGWIIKLFENWKEEKDEVDGYYIYYFFDIDLIIRIFIFYFFRELENGWKMFVLIDVLFEIFDESIKNIEVRDNVKVEERELNLNNFKIEDFKIKCYEYIYYENNEKVYSIFCGIMVVGYLLIVNLYFVLREEVESVIKYIYSIEKVK